MFKETVFYILTCLIFIGVGFYTYKQAFTTRIRMQGVIYWFINVCFALVFISSSDRTIRNYLFYAMMGMCFGALVKEFSPKKRNIVVKR